MGYGEKSLLARKLLKYTLQFLSKETVDKAKPRVIVGRKATGPKGIAGLPKDK
jgi:hypothetical protein